MGAQCFAMQQGRKCKDHVFGLNMVHVLSWRPRSGATVKRAQVLCDLRLAFPTEDRAISLGGFSISERLSSVALSKPLAIYYTIVRPP